MAYTATKIANSKADAPKWADSNPFRQLPGLGLSVLIAVLAFGIRYILNIDALSPLILAILLGLTFHNVIGTPSIAKSGVSFCLKRVLRAGIILLGLQLTTQQIIAVGGVGVGLIVVTLVATFVFTTWLGHVLGVDAKLTQLIAAGSSICGASAVIATNTVTRARDEDVAYAVACVTVFGSLSMVLMPLLAGILDMKPHAFGLWTGASIHEVAQVVAAAYAHSQEAGEFGTLAKLTRVMMLAPFVLCLGFLSCRRLRGGGTEPEHGVPPVPWFVLGFIAMVGLASTGWIPERVMPYFTGLTQLLLATALAALGLETDMRKLVAAGIRPALLGGGAWVFVSFFSLGLVLILV